MQPINKKIFIVAASKLGKIVISFGVSLLIARGIGPSGSGYVNYCMLFVGLYASYGTLGINNANAFFSKQGRWDESEVYGTNLLVNGVSIIALGSLSMLCWILNIPLGVNSGFHLLVLVSLSAATLLVNFFTSIFVANDHSDVSNVISTVSLAFRFLFLLFLLIISHLNVTIVLLLLLGEALINLFLLVRSTKSNIRLRLNKRLFLAEKKYGIDSFLSGLFMFLNYRFAYFLIKKYFGTGDLGVFAIANQLAELVFFIPNSYEQILFSYCLKYPQYDGLPQLYLVIRRVAFLCFAACLIGFTLSPLIVSVYGSAFRRSILVFVLLLPGVFFASLSKVIATFFIANGFANVHRNIAFWLLLANFILSVIFIPRNGIVGAAIAMTLTYLLYLLLYVMRLATVRHGLMD